MGRDLKVTVVGDSAVGKTSLLISYTTNAFPGDHVPTVFDNYSCNSFVENEAIQLGLWDTSGSADFNELRPLSCPGTDAFIVCFSIIDPPSLKDVKEKWYTEIRTHCPTSPIILVGTKLDLRSKPEFIATLKKSGLEPVTQSEGQSMANQISAYKYIECSALTQENLQDVFHETIRSVISPGTTSQTGKPVETSSKTKGKETKKSKEETKKEKEKKSKEPKKKSGFGIGKK